MGEAPSNGWELLHEIATTEANEHDAARLFLHRAGVRAAGPIGLIAPIIEHEIATARRNDTRLVERSVFRNGGSRRRLLGEVIDSMDDRKRLFESTFALPDGRLVTWAEATVADHLARIDMLGRLRLGIDATIGRHEQAVALIQEHNVSCLGEIRGAA